MNHVTSDILSSLVLSSVKSCLFILILKRKKRKKGSKPNKGMYEHAITLFSDFANGDKQVLIVIRFTNIKNVVVIVCYCRTMVGIQYEVLHAQEPILYIIRKHFRQSPTQGKRSVFWLWVWALSLAFSLSLSLSLSFSLSLSLSLFLSLSLSLSLSFSLAHTCLFAESVRLCLHFLPLCAMYKDNAVANVVAEMGRDLVFMTTARLSDLSMPLKGEVRRSTWTVCTAADSEER